MNRIDRLVATVLLLQSRKIVRAQDIAAQFEISTRTVYRDVRALCEAGVPIAAEAGEGYSLVEGYHLPPVMFTTSEASALFLGGKFVEMWTDISMTKHAQSALLKIRSVLPVETQQYLETLQEKTSLLARSTPAPEGFLDDTLSVIQDAVVHQRVLSMEYFSHHRDSFTRRDVEPLGLIFYARHWHLIGYCRLREDFRDFRTDRVRHIRTGDEIFVPREGYSLNDFLATFDKIEDAVEARVHFDRRIVPGVRERTPFGLVGEEEVEDGVIMTFMAPSVRFLASTLLAYGSLARVVEPAELKEALLREARSVAGLYET